MTNHVSAPAHTRQDEPPAACPQCAGRSGTAYWYAYNHVLGAPAAGCGNCGYVVYLTKPLTRDGWSQGKALEFGRPKEKQKRRRE